MRNLLTEWLVKQNPPSRQKDHFGAIRILFGLVWLANTILQSNPAYAEHFHRMMGADMVTGQPIWVARYGLLMESLVSAVGFHPIAWATVGLDGLLAIALLTGLGLPVLAWVGVIYNLWLWSTIGGFGGPYTKGATDPGTAIIYALCFLFVAWSRCWQGLSLSQGDQKEIRARDMETGRILFGMVWLTDAYFKWHPYFLFHILAYLHGALAGQPLWIKDYIGIFSRIIALVGPLHFAIFSALVETAIGVSLVLNIGVAWSIPLGIVWCMGIWTTAEGWGGPYGAGFTANKGDVLGTSNIYLIAFLFLAVWNYRRALGTLTFGRSGSDV